MNVRYMVLEALAVQLSKLDTSNCEFYGYRREGVKIARLYKDGSVIETFTLTQARLALKAISKGEF